MPKMGIKWGFLELVCGVCGEKMIVIPDYKCLYTCENVTKCYNRMTTPIYETLLNKMVDLIEAEPETNYKGYKWKYKNTYHHYEFVVLEHHPEKMVISVFNVKQSKTPY